MFFVPFKTRITRIYYLDIIWPLSKFKSSKNKNVDKFII